MFDSATEDLIREARKLNGLDRDALARELAGTYAAVVGIRANAAYAEVPREAVERLRRLAATYEITVCLMDDASREREACAFVSATAHSLLARLDGVQAAATDSPAISPAGVGNRLTAGLLFLVGRAFADAAEATRALSGPAGSETQQRLVVALRRLCQGSLASLRDLATDSGQVDLESADPEHQLVERCWREIMVGLTWLARYVLGENDDGLEHATQWFERVARASVLQIAGPRTAAEEGGSSLLESMGHVVLGGPHHLATLLSRLAPALGSASLARTPAPPGVEPSEWSALVSRLATTRALLWRNHRAALDKDFLSPGTSAVITFPTGAGKTTLVQLKIGTAALRGRASLLLAPTRALIDQLKRDVEAALGTWVEVRSALEEENEDLEHKASVLVATPEECVAALTRDPELLRDAACVVFDEFHLIHAKEQLADQRSLEAVLCLHSLAERAVDADFVLLSAMVKNGEEIAAWLESLLGRTCIPLDDDWKPTRQARGCVVYGEYEIGPHRENLEVRRLKAIEDHGSNPKWSGKPRSADQKDLLARPLGLFSLRHLWQEKDSRDYCVQPLTFGQVRLRASSKKRPWEPHPYEWHLTANRNEVAAAIAADLASKGIKVMVLSQDPSHLPKLAADGSALLDKAGVGSSPLTDSERDLLERAWTELGGEAHSAVVFGGRAAIHHGLLLPEERRVAEAAFRRTDGVGLLCVSPTMSQGINLPAEAIVIAGDTRFDKEQGRMMRLDAFELLNAAGRAGRAGSCANGLVIVVPGNVVSMTREGGNYTLGAGWFDLRRDVFSKADQCLEVVDPLELWLDELQSHTVGGAVDPTVARFLYKLPGEPESQRVLFNQSLVAFQRRADLGTLQSQIERVVALRSALPAWETNWQREVGVANGLPPSVVQSLVARLDEVLEIENIAALVNWWFQWVCADRARATTIFPDDVLGSFKSFKEGAEITWTEREQRIQLLHIATATWVAGEPLAVIQQRLIPGKQPGLCDLARKFALRSIQRVSWMIAVIPQLIKAREVARGLPPPPTVLMSKLDGCVRRGFDVVEKLALSTIVAERGGDSGRVSVHAVFSELESRLEPPPIAGEDWGQCTARVTRAFNR